MPEPSILVRDVTGMDAAEYLVGRMAGSATKVDVTGLCPAWSSLVTGLARTIHPSLGQPLCASLALKGASMAQTSTGPSDRSLHVSLLYGGRTVTAPAES
jgi:hypothetical protein